MSYHLYNPAFLTIEKLTLLLLIYVTADKKIFTLINYNRKFKIIA